MEQIQSERGIEIDTLSMFLGHYIAGRICAMSLQRVDFFLVEKTYEMSVNINRMIERGIYETFHVDGNEAEVLTDSYFELYRLLGTEAMLKLYKHYHGDKILSTTMSLTKTPLLITCIRFSALTRQAVTTFRSGRAPLRKALPTILMILQNKTERSSRTQVLNGSSRLRLKTAVLLA